VCLRISSAANPSRQTRGHRLPDQQRNVFDKKHIRSSRTESVNSILFRMFRLDRERVRRLTDERSASLQLSISRPGALFKSIPMRGPRHNRDQRPGLSFSGNQFTLSVDRRTAVFYRVFFEHFGFPRAKKIWCFPLGSIPRRILAMKKLARLMIATLVLLSAVSISSFADGGAPPPMCAPGYCGGK
jgi:hypothetical protein